MVESTVRQHIGACFSALEHKVLSQLSEACEQLASMSNASTQDKPLLQVRIGSSESMQTGFCFASITLSSQSVTPSHLA